MSPQRRGRPSSPESIAQKRKYGTTVSVRIQRLVWAAVTRCPGASVYAISAEVNVSIGQVSIARRVLADQGYIAPPPGRGLPWTVITPFITGARIVREERRAA